MRYVLLYVPLIILSIIQLLFRMIGGSILQQCFVISLYVSFFSWALLINRLATEKIFKILSLGIAVHLLLINVFEEVAYLHSLINDQFAPFNPLVDNTIRIYLSVFILVTSWVLAWLHNRNKFWNDDKP